MEVIGKNGHLEKKVSDISLLKFEESKTLFPIDLRDAGKGYCPYCGCNLYRMKNKPLAYCKSTKHKVRFIIAIDKVFVNI